MAVPTTNISLLGLQRELSDNNYNSSRSYTNISLNSISTGGSSQINRLNPLTKIRSSTRGTGGYKLADFASYDHNFDFVSAAIKFNTGNALFRTDADEARTYGVTANKSYAKQYLASGTPYGELQLIANKNIENTPHTYETIVGDQAIEDFIKKIIEKCDKNTLVFKSI